MPGPPAFLTSRDRRTGSFVKKNEGGESAVVCLPVPAGDAKPGWATHTVKSCQSDSGLEAVVLIPGLPGAARRPGEALAVRRLAPEPRGAPRRWRASPSGLPTGGRAIEAHFGVVRRTLH